MFLKRKIASSSLAEVVIALSVIALCFGVASLIFVRFTVVASNYQFIQKQTEVQSLFWKKMQDRETELEYDEVELTEEQDDNLAAGTLVTAKDITGKVIWYQQLVKENE